MYSIRHNSYSTATPLAELLINNGKINEAALPLAVVHVQRAVKTSTLPGAQKCPSSASSTNSAGLSDQSMLS